MGLCFFYWTWPSVSPLTAVLITVAQRKQFLQNCILCIESWLFASGLWYERMYINNTPFDVIIRPPIGKGINIAGSINHADCRVRHGLQFLSLVIVGN